MSIELPDCNPTGNETGEEYYSCVICGNEIKMSEIPVDSWSVTPTVGETLTGVTSTDTSVVVDWIVYTGTIAGGDATGYITVKTLTGTSVDSDTLVETMYQDNETLTGSTGGADMMTVNGTPQIQKYGRLYPESDIVEFRGKKYCSGHANWHINHLLEDEMNHIIEENDRGPTW